ncbi:EamA family transporter [Bacillus pseudomycoides]|uniref:EamA family transporter n=1 Tax=Bacillus bingmayongensis TaxID=1150157 RepID=A0ABU5K3T4_9BACI|nr:EamA family transporter [Bacillus pseudomycoides]
MLKESAQIVQNKLIELGLKNKVVELPESTRTAQEAADAIGCEVAQIAKSIIFKLKSSDEFFTVILTYLFLKEEPLRINFFIGFVVAITGIYFISFNGTSNFHLNPLGDLLAVTATLVWDTYSVLTRKISSYGYNTIQTTRRVFFYGILLMIPALFLFDFQLELERFANPVSLFNILFLGLGASALCFITWNYAVKALGTVKTSVYIYVVPVITVLTSMIVLHEQMTYLAVLGTILTLAGLFISESKIKLKKKEKFTNGYTKLKMHSGD